MLELLGNGNVSSSVGKVMRKGGERARWFILKTPHGSAVSRKAPFGGCWNFFLFYELSLIFLILYESIVKRLWKSLFIDLVMRSITDRDEFFFFSV